jgi:hypothetical protein
MVASTGTIEVPCRHASTPIQRPYHSRGVPQPLSDDLRGWAFCERSVRESLDRARFSIGVADAAVDDPHNIPKCCPVESGLCASGHVRLGEAAIQEAPVPVEAIDEFQPRTILGYRKAAARIDKRDNGFEVNGLQRRVLADRTGRWFRVIAPGQDAGEAPWGFPTKDGLERLVEQGVIRRLGPVRRGPDAGRS